jgi:hypothetical protein
MNNKIIELSQQKIKILERLKNYNLKLLEILKEYQVGYEEKIEYKNYKIQIKRWGTIKDKLDKKINEEKNRISN